MTSAAVPGQGGTEAKNSNELLHGIIRDAIVAVAPEVGPGAVSLVNTRGEIGELLKLDDVIDLVIPRGGNALVSYIQHNTRIPVMGHADGICHIYIDAAADIDAACAVVVDAKTDYPAACNAVEKVLVHEALFGPRLYKLQARGCPRRSLQGSVVRVATTGAMPALRAAEEDRLHAGRADLAGRPLRMLSGFPSCPCEPREGPLFCKWALRRWARC